MRRERFSLTSAILLVIATALGIWAAYYFWPRSYYQPPASALNWYQRGTDAIRNGAYYQASKLLEQAIGIDGNYALARARLAQALTELDYVDKAKDELLAADRSTLSPLDAFYFDAITSTVRRDFDGAVKSYEEILKLSPNDGQVYVDLGYAYENGGNTDKALENYLKSISATNSQYATAFLRAAIIYNRKLDAAKATEFFDKAEQLYTVETNNEGINEVRRQRGILFRDQGKYDEARKQFERSLEAARALGNQAQQINSLIELSFLLSTQGKIAESADFASQAVKLAQDQQLENLAAGGLLELGNGYFNKGDYANAEKYYLQTIELAQANKGKRRVAQGQLNLGGLYVTQLQTDKGLELVNQALSFFQQGNYSRDVSRCLTQIARGKRRQGYFDAALEALNQKLQIAQQGGSQVPVADCYVEMGGVLFAQERYPEALQRYDQADAIYKAFPNRVKLVYSQTNRSNTLWRLGQTAEAKQVLGEGVVTASQSEGEFKQLIPLLRLIAAEISLSERNFSEAASKGNEAITLASTNYRDVAIEASFTTALAKALSGGGNAALTLGADAVKIANETGDSTLLSQALLAQAQVALHNGDAKSALILATQAQERLSQGSQLESQWRASLIAALASEKLGDTGKREQYLAQARSALLQLQQAWGETNFKLYSARPDIQFYLKQLG